jgi:hypothetical protein
MFNKLKDALIKSNDEELEQQRKKSAEFTILSA